MLNQFKNLIYLVRTIKLNKNWIICKTLKAVFQKLFGLKKSYIVKNLQYLKK